MRRRNPMALREVGGEATRSATKASSAALRGVVAVVVVLEVEPVYIETGRMEEGAVAKAKRHEQDIR